MMRSDPTNMCRNETHKSMNRSFSSLSVRSCKTHGNLLANMIEQEYSDMKKQSVVETGHEKWLNRFMTAIIVTNFAQLGICNDLIGTLGELGLCRSASGALAVAIPQCTMACDGLDQVFLTAYLIELTYKLFDKRQVISENWKDFFLDFYNVVDIAVVVTGVLDAWILTPIMKETGVSATWVTQLLQLFRLMRILRVIKFLRRFKKLNIILEGLLEAIFGMIWIGVLLAVLIYCAAILALMYFRDSELNFDGGLTFESLPKAFFTMFSVSIAAEWTPVVQPIVDYYWWGGIFWGSFSFVMTLGMLNLIIGIITERTSAVQRAYEERDRKRQNHQYMLNIQKISDRFFSQDKDMKISRTEMARLFEEALLDEDMKKVMSQLPLPLGWNFNDCFTMLDMDHDGQVTQHEFEEEMCCLILNNQAQSTLTLQKSVADMALRLKGLEGMLHGMEGRFKEEKAKDELLVVAQRLIGLEEKFEEEKLANRVAQRVDECLSRFFLSSEPKLHGGVAAPRIRNAAEQVAELSPGVGGGSDTQCGLWGHDQGFHEALLASLAVAGRAADSVLRSELGSTESAALISAAAPIVKLGSDAYISELAPPVASRSQRGATESAALISAAVPLAKLRQDHAVPMAQLRQNPHISDAELAQPAASRPSTSKPQRWRLTPGAASTPQPAVDNFDLTPSNWNEMNSASDAEFVRSVRGLWAREFKK